MLQSTFRIDTFCLRFPPSRWSKIHFPNWDPHELVVSRIFQGGWNIENQRKSQKCFISFQGIGHFNFRLTFLNVCLLGLRDIVEQLRSCDGSTGQPGDGAVHGPDLGDTAGPGFFNSFVIKNRDFKPSTYGNRSGYNYFFYYHIFYDIWWDLSYGNRSGYNWELWWLVDD
jgi:hypothetical protein